MPDFVALRDRDAWGIIRGYVYQVDLTIERWLNLPDGCVLELERGEDIDLVAQAIGTENEEERQRLLEQVKHRDQNLTLRSASAIEALANAVAHRQTNPDLILIFRYSSNAGIGRERPSFLPLGEAAIAVWEQLRLGSYSIDAQSVALAGIRRHLLAAQQPVGFPEEEWATFQRFIQGSDDTALLDFVRIFEWRTGEEDAAQLGQHIQRLLITKSYATDLDEAKELYHRLFFFVFKLLSQPGLKRLSDQDLQTCNAQPLRSDEDRALLRVVVNVLDTFDSRLTAVERTSQQHDESLFVLHSHMQRLANDLNIGAAQRYTIAAPVIEIPPLQGQVSRRVQTVTRLLERTAYATWIAVHGPIGSGKTTLAILLAQEFGTCRAWLGMRGLTTEQACQRLDAVCREPSRTPSQAWADWYKVFCRKLGAGSLLVLDDLPRLRGDDDLSRRILLLIETCNRYSIRLISTSPYSLPIQIEASIDPGLFLNVETPRLDDQEVAETLQAYGAPSGFNTPARIRSLNNLGQGNPVLIGSIARYLQKHGWHLDDAAFEGLLRRAYANDINDATIHELLQHVTDMQSRELLYRLNVPLGAFSQDEVYILSRVNPGIDHPGEHLHSLLGLWVQRDTQGRLLVSPLVKAFAERELAPETLRACHQVLAERIVQQRALTQLDAASAILHFHSAGHAQRAGTILLSFLSELLKLDITVEDAGLLMYWASLPLPEEMELGTQIVLRGFQMAARRTRGLDIEFLKKDADRLVKRSSASEASALLLLIVNNHQLETDRWLAYLRTFVQFLPEAQHLDNALLRWPDTQRLGQLIWFCNDSLTTPRHYALWIDIVASLPAALREHAFAEAPAEEACMHIANRLWLLESEKPVEEQHWDGVYESMVTLADQAWDMGLTLLWACAVRSQIVILSEYHHDIGTALSVAEAALALEPQDDRACFLIQECMGRQYSYARRLEAAEVWLRKAVANASDAYPETRANAWLHIAETVDVQNRVIALNDVQQAVNIVDTAQNVSDYTKVKAYAELALAHWFLDSQPEAYEAWARAVEYLLSSRANTEAWKSLFVLFGHVSGYLSSMAASGEPPPHLEDGQEYAAPVQGVFLTHHAARAQRYDPALDSVLFAQLSHFAEAVGRDDQAIRWALRAVDQAREDNLQAVIASMGERVITHLLLADRFDDALGVALDIGPAYQAMQEERRQGINIRGVRLPIEDLLGPRPGRPWYFADFRSAIAGLAPVAFHLSTIALEQPDRARADARVVASLCGQISESQVNQQLWIEAADVFDMIAEGNAGFEGLMRWGRERQGEFDFVLQLISYLCATWQPDALLEQAAAVHLHLLPMLATKGILPQLTYRRVVLPYILRYWSAAIRRERFRFRGPRLVEEDLRAYARLPPPLQAQAILRTVANSLGIPVPSDAHRWFHEAAQSE